jgi:hypothetical protein
MREFGTGHEGGISHSVLGAGLLDIIDPKNVPHTADTRMIAMVVGAIETRH